MSALLLFAVASSAQMPPMTPDIPDEFMRPMDSADYHRREEMVRMRDGVRLHTVIIIPKSTHDAPMVLTRTPYGAAGRAMRRASPVMAAMLPVGDELFAAAGYIRVFQNVRGKHESEGQYVLTRPLAGPLNQTGIDHSTDAYDTVEWLVNSIPESNGRVAIVGASYEGYTALMGAINPHPAVKAMVAVSPMVDGWKGDDWFHNGAFRQTTFSYLNSQTTVKGDGAEILRPGYDDYDDFLRHGSAVGYARHYGFEQLPFFRKILEHPTYDGFWRHQAVDVLLKSRPNDLPKMFVGSFWDQEDSYGTVAAYSAAEQSDTDNDRNFLVLGPWRHSGANHEGVGIGVFKFGSDTALHFRRQVLFPFLQSHLQAEKQSTRIPPVVAFETGTNAWASFDRWPPPCGESCSSKHRRVFLDANSHLSFVPPATEGFDEYISDPAKPIPFMQRPMRFDDRDNWKEWLVSDQRPFSDRPDVITYVSDTLSTPVHVAGAPQAQLHASTTGSDADWIVKLIDVYPDADPARPELGGYQLGIAMEIFRGRYREDFARASPITPNRAELYAFPLPNVNHVFRRGHRIMVQIQSTWFPLYDRNPQTFVQSIFMATASDYKKAVHRIHRGGDRATAIALPVVP